MKTSTLVIIAAVAIALIAVVFLMNTSSDVVSYSYANGDGKSTRRGYRVKTTNATQTSMTTNGDAVATNGSNVVVVGKNKIFSGVLRVDASSSGTKGAVSVVFQGSTDADGVVTVATSTSTTITALGVGWAVAVAGSTTNLLFKVTGAASTTINWYGYVDMSISPLTV